MKTVERIFQAILFEVTVLSVIIPSSVIIGGFDSGEMTIVAVAISLFAMIWNYIYNLIFDKLMGFNRFERGPVIRISHAVGFELGMVVIALPMMAWYLEITLLAAAILEAAFLVFILVYTLVFNWVYDRYQPYQKCFNKRLN